LPRMSCTVNMWKENGVSMCKIERCACRFHHTTSRLTIIFFASQAGTVGEAAVFNTHATINQWTNEHAKQ
jgi:hypothetical protein